jgi:hypothetical protein
MNIYTSIPPKVSRFVDGQDVGNLWTRMCVNSWLEAGYTIYSVNSEKESSSIASLYPDVNIIEVNRDGSHIVGRPLVYISDIIKLAIQSNQRYFALVNADIMISKDASAALKGWIPENGFAYSTRLDIDDLSGKNPRVHGGVDFLILETKDVVEIDLPDILFGTPWWDYWLPISLNCRGINGRRLIKNNAPVITHLFHDERWSHTDLFDNFNLFIAELIKAVQQRDRLPSYSYKIDANTGLPGSMLSIILEYARTSSGLIHQLNPSIEL